MNILMIIDGPCGSGKTTLIKSLAEKYQAIIYPTGMIFRAIAHSCLQTPQKDPLKATKDFCDSYKFGQPLPKNLKSREVSLAATALSDIPGLIEFPMELQNRFITNLYQQGNDVIADGSFGQDFPKMNVLHFFVTADIDVRAKRLAQTRHGRGYHDHLFATKEELVKRDKMDSHNVPHRLTPLPFAHVINTTENTPDQTLKQAEYLITHHQLGNRLIDQSEQPITQQNTLLNLHREKHDLTDMSDLERTNMAVRAMIRSGHLKNFDLA